MMFTRHITAEKSRWTYLVPPCAILAADRRYLHCV